MSIPKEMNRLRMIRGNNDAVFFAETKRKSERIMMIHIDHEAEMEL